MRSYQFFKNKFSYHFPLVYRLADRYKKLIKFGIVGVAATGFNLAVLYTFTDILGVWYLLSAVAAFVVAFVVSFSFQKFWTFRDNSVHRITGQMFFYFILTFGSLLLNLVGLYALVDLFVVHYLVSQMILSVILALMRFAVNNFLIFNIKNETPDTQEPII